MGLADNLGKDNIVLVITSKTSYSNCLTQLQPQVGNSFDKIGYITVNKPFNSVKKDLSDLGMETGKFIFADVITATVQAPPPVDNCIFVSSPNALTDLGLAFTSLYNEYGCEIVVFDTISTLVVYQDIGSVIKFVHNFVTKARVIGKKLVLIALKEDSETLIKDLNMFVDSIVEMG